MERWYYMHSHECEHSNSLDSILLVFHVLQGFLIHKWWFYPYEYLWSGTYEYCYCNDTDNFNPSVTMWIVGTSPLDVQQLGCRYELTKCVTSQWGAQKILPLQASGLRWSYVTIIFKVQACSSAYHHSDQLTQGVVVWIRSMESYDY